MSSYLNTLQDEEYRPSSRSRSTSARRSRQQQQQQQQQQSLRRSSLEDNSSSGTDHLEGSSSYDDSDRFNSNHRAAQYYPTDSPARQPVGRTPSKNLAHHHRASVPKSTSRHSTVNIDKGTTTSREGNTRKNGKAPKTSQNKNGKSKKPTKLKQTGGRIIRDSEHDDSEASADFMVRQNDTPSERSSSYNTGRYDREEEDHDDPFRSSDHRPISRSRQRQREPSIYDAYRRLSIVGPSHAISAREEHEEEHSSNNAYSQQTPATSSSTQPSSATDDELNQSPASNHPPQPPAKQRSTPKRKKKKQSPPGSSISGASKSSQSHTTKNSQELSQGKATKKKNQQPPSPSTPSSTEDPPYQRKNSKNSKSSRGKREKSGSAVMDKSSNSSVPKQLHVVEELAQPSLYGDDPFVAEDMIVSEEAQRPPTRSTDLTSASSSKKAAFALKDSLSSGELAPHYSKTMLDVKDSLREDIEVPKTKKSNKKRRGSAASISSSASGSSGFAIMEFLHNKVPGRNQVSEEERRKRGNPFLNRPPAFKKHTGVGYYDNAEDDSSNNDNTGRRASMVPGSDFGEFSDDESRDHTRSLTLQEKYCPLPEPIRLLQRFCGKIVTNQEFQIVMVVLIMLNALILGIATYKFSNPAVPEALDVMDRMLLVIFTIELALQVGYCGYTLLLDGWLVFDTLTIVTSWWLEGVQVFRSFRIFRSFRLIVRLPLLKNLVLTVFHVMPRIYSILSLLILILYIFGVLCTILFGDLYEDGFTDTNYFGRLDYSVFTLFQMVTLEGWGDIVRQVGEVHEFYASLVFSVFIVVTGFIMYNLIVAVMCDSMLVVEAQAREEARELKKLKRALAERAIEQEEKKLEEEMNNQRLIEKQTRERINGVVNDDPSMDNKDGNTLATLDSISEEDSVVPMRDHMCDNCGFCSEIPILPPSVRRRNRERDRMLEDNQARVEGLKQKLDHLVGTQQQVTAVLQTLMFQIEAQRKAQVKAPRGNTSVTSKPETTDTSTGSSRDASW